MRIYHVLWLYGVLEIFPLQYHNAFGFFFLRALILFTFMSFNKRLSSNCGIIFSQTPTSATISAQ